jgi:hypothetical protein
LGVKGTTMFQRYWSLPWKERMAILAILIAFELIVLDRILPFITPTTAFLGAIVGVGLTFFVGRRRPRA